MSILAASGSAQDRVKGEEHGKRKTKKRGAEEHQEGGVLRPEKEDHLKASQEDAHRPGEAGKQGKAAEIAEKVELIQLGQHLLDEVVQPSFAFGRPFGDQVGEARLAKMLSASPYLVDRPR